MTAFNAVRFRVKPGRDQEFLDAHRNVNADWPGLKRVNMIKTGERTYCIIAEWTDMDTLAAARPQMLATLNTFRDTLEDVGAGLGVTDPITGPVVLELKKPRLQPGVPCAGQHDRLDVRSKLPPVASRAIGRKLAAIFSPRCLL